MPEFDAIIIGTGQAGPSLAHRLAGAGMRVAIVERHRFGGTCVNTGCTPTKTLVASAYAAHLARRAAEFGVTVDGPVSVDMKKVKERKDYVLGLLHARRRALAAGATPRSPSTRATRASPRPREVAVGDEMLSAPQIFINVGGRAFVPDIPGLEQVAYFTNSTMLDVDFVPPHLIVVGGSYIGLEFAQIFRRFGSEVTVIEMAPRLIAREDEDVSAAVAEILKGEGIDMRLGVHGLQHRASAATTSPSASIRRPATHEVVGTHLLMAVGRRPNTDDLGLDKAGVATDKRGFIEVDDQLRTSVPGIWALGDCNGRGAFTHTSYNDFEIVAANLLDNDPRRVSDRIAAYNLYTDPPLGRVGLTEAEVRKSGRPALMATHGDGGRRPRLREGRDAGLHEDPGRRETKQILGASILGVGGDEVIHSHPRPHVRQGALHRDAAGRAHPPDRVGAAPDHAGRPEAAGVGGRELWGQTLWQTTYPRQRRSRRV